MAPGYWGETTSTLDWCEKNYEVTYYIAEFWNTLTNLSMIIPPLYGIWAAHKHNFEKRFVISYICLLTIGFGSWMFHMTLQYEMQLMDELPMVYACAVFIYCLYEVATPKTIVNWNLVVFLVVYCFIVTVVYLIIKNPIFHEVMYGILVFWMMYMDYKITMKHCSKTIVTLFIVGISMYLLGFFFWILDNKFCNTLEGFRQKAPTFLVPFSQFHGWWHLLAGYSTYLHILANIYHRQTSLAAKKFDFDWGWIGITLSPSQEKPE